MILYTPVSRADNSMNTVRLFIVFPRVLDEASLPDEKWSRRQPGSMGKVSGRPKTRIGILIPGTGEKAQACDEPKSSPDLPERPATAVALRRRAIISVFSRLSPILGRFHSRASTKNLPLRIASITFVSFSSYSITRFQQVH